MLAIQAAQAEFRSHRNPSIRSELVRTDFAHSMKNVAETGVYDVVFRDAEERSERCGIRNIVGGKCGERIDLV